MSSSFVRLPRDIVAIGGSDCRSFLQGLISQDIERVTDDTSAYGALLTPQGKYLHDFFICISGSQLLLDCEAGRGADLIGRLSRFKLRADVVLEERADLSVAAAFGPNVIQELGLPEAPGTTLREKGVITMADPRLPALGCRIIGPWDEVVGHLKQTGLTESAFESYDTHRISLEVPDGSRDMEIEKSTLLESNFEPLNGIDWEKGCYMGQELTARTKYRGLVKRRLAAFRATSPSQEPGRPVMIGDRTVGEIRSRSGDHLLVSIRLDALSGDSNTITAENSPLQPLSQ